MSALYTRLVSRFLFPLHEKLKGHESVQLLNRLEKSQWWSPKELEADQLQRLNSFLSQARDHVPYYKKVIDASGITPGKVSQLSDLRRLPLLTKQLIRENIEDLKADNAGRLQRYNTGGSSGEPLVFYMGMDRVSHDVAAKWRATRWWDVDIGDREIVIWGSPVELGAQDRVRALRDSVLRSRLVPAFEMSMENVDRFIAQISAFRPKMLFGYPSSLSLIAERAEKLGVKMDRLGIAVAFVTSERLYDHQKLTIERVFGCRVANGYGGRDAGFIAHQCQSGGMHISAEDIIVEILDETGEPVSRGTSGEIVVTHLATGSFPFIRYRTGDIAAVSNEPCACGRGLPLLSSLEGRNTDFVIATDGTIMHGLALIYILRDIPEVKEFKIVQEDIHHTRILLVPSDNYTDAHNDVIRQGFQKRLGKAVDISIEPVQNIPREKSGKFRYVVSHVSPEQVTGE